MARSARTEVRAYLRSNGNGPGPKPLLSDGLFVGDPKLKHWATSPTLPPEKRRQRLLVELIHSTLRQELRRMGHPGVWGWWRRTSNGKSKIRGFFAALRMTKCGGELRGTSNGKCNGEGNNSRSLRDDKQRTSNSKGDVWVSRVYGFPTRRPIRPAQDGAPERLGLSGGEIGNGKSRSLRDDKHKNKQRQKRNAGVSPLRRQMRRLRSR